MSDDLDLDLLLPELDLCVDDDPEILRAALDFIEACEASDSSSDDSDESPAIAPPQIGRASEASNQPSAPAPVVATATSKPRRVTRNRRKEEIAELRVLVAELEKQVAGRKRKFVVPETVPFALATNSNTHDDLPKSGTSINMSVADVSVVWEHISKRQQQQRQLAELENAKLRNMVLDQLKVARELTRVAKRRALLEGRSESLDEMFTPLPSMDTNESPLMVRIYPSRPSMPSRVGMAMPLAGASSNALDDHRFASDAAMDGTPVGAAWTSRAVAVEQSQATRVAWQSALRTFLKRRRAALCHERVEDIFDSVLSSTDPTNQNQKVQHLDRGLVYTQRYSNGCASGARPTHTMCQNPSALLRSLLSPRATLTLNFRLFRLQRPRPVARGMSDDEMNDVTARLGGLSLRQETLPMHCATATRSSRTWQCGSLHASSCF